MKLLYPLLNVAQIAFLAVWGAFWISLAGLMMVLTLNGNVPLMMARRCWAPMHWRITGSRMFVEPLPDLDWSKPYIFVMNHQSAMDIQRAGVRVAGPHRVPAPSQPQAPGGDSSSEPVQQLDRFSATCRDGGLTPRTRGWRGTLTPSLSHRERG